MAENHEVKFELTARDEVRAGRYSNFQRVASSPSETIIDFCFLDDEARGENDEPVAFGVLQSRIIMSNQKFVEMYQLIKSHVEQNFSVSESND